MLDRDQLAQLIEAIRRIQLSGWGSVSIVIEKGRPAFLEVTESTKLSTRPQPEDRSMDHGPSPE